MRLGIDLDGVVADFTGGWIARYNREFAATLEPRQVTSWNGVTDITHFASRHEFWRWARNEQGPSIFRHLATYPGAAEALAALARTHEVVIVTSKPNWAVHDTFAWIAERRIPTREVHIVAQKWVVACDVYLDDNPLHLRDLRHNRRGATVCRYVRAWNHPIDGVHDITGWDEFTALVHDLAHR